MTEDLLPLADAVLPLIRSRSRELWRYSVAGNHGVQMQEGVDALNLALTNPKALPHLGIATPTAQDVFHVVHKALASAIRVIARADDSDGIIGNACRELIELHPRAAAGAEVDELKLADWFYRFHFNDEVDYFELDPVAYAPALGAKGLDRLRQNVAILRAEVPPPDPADKFAAYKHNAFLLTWFEKRLA